MAEATFDKANSYVPVEADFRLKGKTADDFVDTNFASQNFWKEVVARFWRKKSAVIGLVFVLVISFFAFIGPVMNEYTYSGQNLENKNLAPRIPIIEYTGLFDGHENMKSLIIPCLAVNSHKIIKPTNNRS